VGVLLHFHYGTDEIALVAPQLEEATAVLLVHGEMSGPHVEQDMPVFKDCCSWVVA
jgi:hypothetical protein